MYTVYRLKNNKVDIDLKIIYLEINIVFLKLLLTSMWEGLKLSNLIGLYPSNRGVRWWIRIRMLWYKKTVKQIQFNSIFNPKIYFLKNTIHNYINTIHNYINTIHNYINKIHNYKHNT